MAPIRALLFLALSLSISGAIILDQIQAPNNSLAFLAIPVFLYFLLPFTFTISLILLLLHAVAPQSTYITRLTSITRVLVSATLLLGAPPMVHAAFVQAPTPGTLMAVYVGAALILVHKYILCNIYSNLTTQTVGSLVPASVALCFSTGVGIFLLMDPFVSLGDPNGESTSAAHTATIKLLLLALNFFNFVLAMGLLFVRMSVPADGPRITVPVV